MIRVCSLIEGDGPGLTLSLMALVVDSAPACVALHVYSMSLAVNVLNSLPTHICYSQLNSTIAIEVGRVEWAE
jgi:hypothetical protein